MLKVRSKLFPNSFLKHNDDDKDGHDDDGDEGDDDNYDDGEDGGGDNGDDAQEGDGQRLQGGGNNDGEFSLNKFSMITSHP